ncbi:LOW QUALITY PROTEIN: hypothetical protein RJ640_029098 [Escallonia rubra]|uniref:ADP-ribosyl cyclase/cyclic ADP-ribose hydrolase n=1 Tax=Escallonia rubra TaxID=112253 RepID=A0AA88RJW3_9ASTE|nr:LOW QUALITY PROTEIN: hypothetical protein RJ640_029098 [Escallonia rubra]
MAVAPEASASSRSHDFKYDAFLSFRGEDTRTTFTTDLFQALKAADLKPFMDDDGIKRGNTITSELEGAIRNSRVSIIIFSENYASSSWCLNELLYIFDQYRSQTKTHGIFPLFYRVDPSIVLNDKEDDKREKQFEKALDEREKTFGKKKVDQWREVLIGCGLVAEFPFPNQKYSFPLDFSHDTVRTTGKEVGTSIKEAPVFRYDELLSYASMANRENFIELLDGELRSSNFIPFKAESNGMDREEDDTSELDAAISRSRSSVIVFSRNYAYSPRSETKRLVIIPVFYGVSKDQIRMQAERLAASLPGMYDKQFKREKVERWKEAIIGVAQLPAAVAFSGAATKRHLKQIVEAIKEKADRRPLPPV